MPSRPHSRARNACGIWMSDAGAVPGVDLAAAGAAVQQVLEHGERLAHDGVRLSALDVDDEADAAGVVLVGGIVEALRRRQSPGSSTSPSPSCGPQLPLGPPAAWYATVKLET